MPLFATPFAQLDLVRQPEQDGEPLQAFDAADEYLLNQLHERGVTAQCRVLVLNDAFGALAASLAPHVQVTSSGDSHLGFLALRKNLARNGLDLCNRMFEVTGARSTHAALRLDRYWRNLRTQTLHDPLDYKIRELGDWALNQSPPQPTFYS